jgi:hypothetical protein
METYGQDFYQKDGVAKRFWKVGWGLVFVCAMTLLTQCIPQTFFARVCHVTAQALHTTPRPFIK